MKFFMKTSQKWVVANCF